MRKIKITCPERDSIPRPLYWSVQNGVCYVSRYLMSGSLELYSICNRWIYSDLLYFFLWEFENKVVFEISKFGLGIS
jgi:hypothetical protein